MNSDINLENVLLNIINNNIINTSLFEGPTLKHVISEEEFNKLEKKPYSMTSPYNNTCPITQIEFVNEEEIIELPCSHYFNPIAIKKWLMEEKGECPVCRYKFTTIEINTPEPITILENTIYNPNTFNNIFNNFMQTEIIYVYY
jgi:hypothetical protein